MWSDIGSFGLSYLLVALGVLAAVVLLRSARQDYKVVGVFVASAAALLGSAVCFGTIEEQFLYFLSVPAVISVSVVGTEAYRRMGLTAGAFPGQSGTGIATRGRLRVEPGGVPNTDRS